MIEGISHDGQDNRKGSLSKECTKQTVYQRNMLNLYFLCNCRKNTARYVYADRILICMKIKVQLHEYKYLKWQNKVNTFTKPVFQTDVMLHDVMLHDVMLHDVMSHDGHTKTLFFIHFQSHQH
jgi:hypothetical protein